MQFQEKLASVFGGTLTTNTHIGRLRRLGQTIYIGHRFDLTYSNSTVELSCGSQVDLEVHFCPEWELYTMALISYSFWVKTFTDTVKSRNSFGNQDIFFIFIKTSLEKSQTLSLKYARMDTFKIWSFNILMRWSWFRLKDWKIYGGKFWHMLLTTVFPVA